MRSRRFPRVPIRRRLTTAAAVKAVTVWMASDPNHPNAVALRKAQDELHDAAIQALRAST